MKTQIADLRSHRIVPRQLRDGPIKLYPVEVTGTMRILQDADGTREVHEVIIDQRTWSILLDVLVRQESAYWEKQK